MLSIKTADLEIKIVDSHFLQHYEIVDNSRFLVIQPEQGFFQKEIPLIYNLGSRCLGLGAKWISKVWETKTRVKPKLLLTYVDTSKNFTGTVYKASNWKEIGTTKGVLNKNSRSSPKRTFIYPLTKSDKCLPITEFTKEYLQKHYDELNPTAQYNYRGDRVFTDSQKERQMKQKWDNRSNQFFK